jgi:hypothetical protein
MAVIMLSFVLFLCLFLIACFSNNAFLISAGAAAMIAQTGTNARVVGVITIVVSVLCVLYSYWQYRRRSRAIVSHDPDVGTVCFSSHLTSDLLLPPCCVQFNYESVWGPTLFALAFIVAFVLVVLMAWSLRLNPTCTNLTNNNTAVDVWGGTVQQRGLEFVHRLRYIIGNDICGTATGIADIRIRADDQQ